MIALDTNIIVRFLINDDIDQAEKVRQLLKKAEQEKKAYFISLLVVQELVWVLDAVYECSRNEIINAIEKLTYMPVFEFENIDLLRNVIEESKKSKYDVSDLLIAFSAINSGCRKVLTFDEKASRFKYFVKI
jgi:predicted nucleic-acid-binding protein